MTPALASNQQLSLFADSGVDELPAGMAELSLKQAAFVAGYLANGGNAAAAAREAGYADPEADATKILRSKKVVTVVVQARRSAAVNVVHMLATARAELQAYEKELAEIYPKVRDMVAKGLPIKVSDDDRAQANYRDQLNHWRQRERDLNQEIAARRKLLCGEKHEIAAAVQHTHTLAPEMQAHLLELQAGLLEAAA